MESADIKKLFRLEGQEISELGNNLDLDKFQSIINLINKRHGNIFVAGCGTSAMAAKKIVHTFNVISESAFYLNPSDAVHGGLGAVRSEDLVIIISKGGNTKELLSFIPSLKEKKAKIIAITENSESFIGKASDFLLRVHVDKELDKYNMLATASTMAVISVFDVMAVILMETEQFSETQFLMNHPSGAVGQRLRRDVN